MTFEAHCPHCSNLLRIPEHAAGKRVRCPSCQTIFSPAERGQPAASPATQMPAKPAAAPPRWTLQTEDGQQFGPVSKTELDQWVEQGRVSAGCQLLPEGAAQWQWASDVYPQLAAAGGIPQSAPGKPGPIVITDNPYASPTSGSSTARMRGRSIPNLLPWAIVSLICCGGIFAIPAIIYAAQANSKKASGDYAGAARDASTAQTWLIVAVVIGVVVSFLSIAAQVAMSTEPSWFLE